MKPIIKFLLPLAFASIPMAGIQSEKPTFAVVPTINISGEKWEELKDKQCKKVHEYLDETFAKRELKQIDSLTVINAIKKLELDFMDEDQPRKPLLESLAKEVKADYVVFAVITATEQKKQDRVFYQDIEGNATVKLWLYETKSNKSLISAKTFIGRSGGNRVGSGKGSDRQIQAAANAVRDGLADFFKAYPEIKK